MICTVHGNTRTIECHRIEYWTVVRRTQKATDVLWGKDVAISQYYFQFKRNYELSNLLDLRNTDKAVAKQR